MGLAAYSKTRFVTKIKALGLFLAKLSEITAPKT
jgi:hypothetical protein